MAGILALLALALAYVFHGAGFNPNAWFGWQGMMLLGLLLLAFELVFPALVAIRNRRAVGVTPPQP